ncbi:MAG TPA: protein kinase, partial [Gemmataceae bacterium]|nr:protein kinase [Gemmataceae bacterium]
MQPCPPPQRLEDFLAERLGDSDRAALEAHLSRCAACQRRLEQLTANPSAQRWQHLHRQACHFEDPDEPSLLRRLAKACHSAAPRAGGLGDPPRDEERPGGRPTAPGLPGIPDYRLERELGRGGMGVVYLARQMSLDRPVAVKMLLTGAQAGPSELARFRLEADAIARVRHPNIAQIYEVGEHEGRPYMVLEYLDGGSLHEMLDGTPQPAGPAARLVETLARAMHAAHLAGIIHRDLKPANILFQRLPGVSGDGPARRPPAPEYDSAGLVPKVTDFGLAKRLGPSAASGPTHTTDVLGSPSYMAPEQAGGKTGDVGPAADTYALGAVLYELITGRPPFKAETSMDTILQVVTEEPVPPRRLRPRCPRDLETICLKCLRKEPRRRYAGAEDLAEDLRRFRAGEPIRARPVSLWARGARWTRRQPRVAALLALLLFTTVGALASLAWAAVSASATAREAGRRADVERDARETEHALRTGAEQVLTQARVALAERQWLANDVAGAERLLDQCRPRPDQPDQRGWEWYYVKRLCRGELRVLPHRYWVWGVAFSPDGHLLATAAGSPGQGTGDPRRDGEVKLWDAATGELRADLLGDAPAPAVHSVSFSPDGRWLLGRDQAGAWHVWDVAARRHCFTSAARAAAFLPHAALLAVVEPDGRVRHLDLATGREAAVIHGPLSLEPWQGVIGAFDATARRLALSALDGSTVEVLDTATGKVVRAFRLTFAGGPGGMFALTPGGSHLLVDGHCFDVGTGEEVGRLPQVWGDLTIDGGGDWLALRGYDSLEVSLIRGPTCTVTRTLAGHSGRHNACAFSPDRRYLATAGTDQTVRLWKVATGEAVAVLRGHTSGVRGLAFSPDGRTLATAGQDQTVRLWDLTHTPHGLHLAGLDARGEFLGSLAFAAGGREVVAARHGPDGWAERRDADTGATLRTQSLDVAEKLDFPRNDSAFGADGTLFAAVRAEDARQIQVWDFVTGRPGPVLRGHSAAVRAVTGAAAADRLASVSEPPPGAATA